MNGAHMHNASFLVVSFVISNIKRAPFSPSNRLYPKCPFLAEWYPQISQHVGFPAQCHLCQTFNNSFIKTRKG